MEAKRERAGNSLQTVFSVLQDDFQTNNKAKLPPMEELEIALEECKFGKFYVRFSIALLFSNIATVLVSSNTAYLLPNAECDLEMTIYQKGMLNAMCYIGMLACGLFAGFLTDTFGRKLFLQYGFLGIFICCLIEGSSQNYETLLVGKFMEGFVSSAALNAVVSIASEMVSKKNKDFMMLLASSFNAVAHVFIALFSWSILPQKWKFVFFNGSFVLSSWNIYLYACSVFSLVACVMHTMLPESPKFLVAHQMYQEAILVLKHIYKENTGKHVDTFPIKSIGSSASIPTSRSINSIQDRRFIKIILASLKDVKPLFTRPLAVYLMLICVMQFMTMLAFNVLRLWYPQLSTIIEHYNKEHKRHDDLCIMLDSYMLENVHEYDNNNITEACIPNRSGSETYINSIILGCVCIIPYVVSATLVNKIGKKLLLLVALGISCSCVTCLGWAESSMQVLALVSTTVALTQACISLLQMVAVDLFPTVCRSLSISLMFMAGRSGTLTGNILFPVLLAQGCLIPFLSISGILICVILLSFLLPSIAGIPTKKVNIPDRSLH